jgi:hypothetical protein
MTVSEKIIIFVISLVLISSIYSSAMAQDIESSEDQFSIYGTLGGYGIIYSAGFEYLTAGRHLGLNVNFSYVTLRDDGDYTLYIVPLFASFYAGGTSHRFFSELGMNYIYGIVKNSAKYYDSSGSGVLGIAGLGYAYTPVDGGFYFKTGPKIIFSEGYFQLWGGISLGFIF